MAPVLNHSEQGFKAFLSHPNYGDDAIEGYVFVDHHALRFRSDVAREQIPIDRVIVALEPDGKGIRFHDPARPELELCTVDRSLLAHQSFVQCTPLQSQVDAIVSRRDLGRRLRQTLAFFAACGLLIWLCSFAMDAMARSLVRHLPPEWEVKFGEEQMKKVRAKFTFVEDTNQVALLSALAAPLLRNIPAGKTGFTFYLVDWYLPNAFALPGGHILVTTGLLDLTDRPEQLLAVIAHEVSHVTQRHHFRHLVSAGGPVLMLQIFLSDRNNNLNLLTQRSGLLIHQTFSQQYEREADETAWGYLVAANVDPHGLIELLQLLKQSGFGDPHADAFSSHPALDKRIQWLEERWDKSPRKSGYLEISNPATARLGTEGDKRFRRLFPSR
jgi:beta-barrel assembly-enhancing protease